MNWVRSLGEPFGITLNAMRYKNRATIESRPQTESGNCRLKMPIIDLMQRDSFCPVGQPKNTDRQKNA